MTRKEWTPLSSGKWDQCVRAFPDAQFYHLSVWAGVIARTYGFRPRYLGWETEGRVKALCSLMELRLPLRRARAVSLPFTDVCCPLVADSQFGIPELVDDVLQFAAQERWTWVDFRLPENVLALEPSLTFLHHQLDLTGGPEALFGALSSAARRNIRTAERHGLQLDHLTGREGARTYYQLHCLTRQRHGLPPQPRAFFDYLGDACLLGDSGFVAVARHEGQPVAAALFLRDGANAFYKYGASDHRCQHLRANNLVMWSAITKLCHEGVRQLDFGRTSRSNEGLRRFKLQWGCRESRLHYYRINPRTRQVQVLPDRAHGWYNHVFRAIPIPLLRIVGRLFYANQG
ncbi:GNAT family N-acetyltransferase [bacterium]|nr:GNAT family N-acetyltransferase [bacterium]